MSERPDYWVNGHSLEKVRNRHELQVVAAMRRILPTVSDFCGCQVCIEDVYARTLNRFPAYYVQGGSTILKPLNASAEELEAEVERSVDAVRHTPKHSLP